MNKLGFYLENTTVPFLRDALRQVKPPVLLIHAGDRGLLRDIRRELAPDTFVVGRIFVDQQEQNAWLDSADPVQKGQAFADRILSYDFGLATEKGANGRLLIDAWMGLNESVRGPASFPNDSVDDQFRRRAAALDSFQVAFRERLQTAGLEAVAFNFGAGNYIKAAHYLDWYPRTLETYRYLGFHEYGWPTLMESPSRGTATSALFYRPCMIGIRARYGDRHRTIVTEAGLARMYKYPSDPAGDVGWLYAGDTIAEDDYWESLRWYSDELAQDGYMLGACLYQVGHSGRWETFRHLGADNKQRPILLMNKIATLNEALPPPPPPPTPPPAQEDLAALQQRIADLMTTLEATARLNTDFQAQVMRLQRTIDGLVPAATAAASLPHDLNRLRERLDVLDAELDHLAATGQASAGTVAALHQETATVRAQIVALEPAARQAATLASGVAKAQQELVPLVKGADEAKALAREVDILQAEARRLAAVAGPPPPGKPQAPAVLDVQRELPRSGRQPAALGYPVRSVDAIQRIVVHHTRTRADITPDRLAEIQVERGLAGIRYHYLVTDDGTSFWMQPLEAVLPATGLAEVNLDSVAIALAGNFSEAVPSAFQLDAAAAIIAWLLGERGLGTADVFGRHELEPAVASPGLQWLQGARFKDSLIDRVEAILAGE